MLRISSGPISLAYGALTVSAGFAAAGADAEAFAAGAFAGGGDGGFITIFGVFADSFAVAVCNGGYADGAAGCGAGDFAACNGGYADGAAGCGAGDFAAGCGGTDAAARRLDADCGAGDLAAAFAAFAANRAATFAAFAAAFSAAFDAGAQNAAVFVAVGGGNGAGSLLRDLGFCVGADAALFTGCLPVILRCIASAVVSIGCLVGSFFALVIARSSQNFFIVSWCVSSIAFLVLSGIASLALSATSAVRFGFGFALEGP